MLLIITYYIEPAAFYSSVPMGKRLLSTGGDNSLRQPLYATCRNKTRLVIRAHRCKIATHTIIIPRYAIIRRSSRLPRRFFSKDSRGRGKNTGGKGKRPQKTCFSQWYKKHPTQRGIVRNHFSSEPSSPQVDIPLPTIVLSLRGLARHPPWYIHLYSTCSCPQLSPETNKQKRDYACPHTTAVPLFEEKDSESAAPSSPESSAMDNATVQKRLPNSTASSVIPPQRFLRPLL